MLQRLIIKNFAIIESADIDFSEGLNIITGETGSGKSLIVNAIDLLMGAKFSKQNFRNKEEILVMGCFKYNGRQMEVKRKFHFSGKHKTFINDDQVTNQELRQTTMNYIDITLNFLCYSFLFFWS